jgi:hypothetical protein
MAQIILLSILSIICLLMLLLVFSELNNRFARLSMIILYLLAPIFLWHPDMTSKISQAFGIGRGGGGGGGARSYCVTIYFCDRK